MIKNCPVPICPSCKYFLGNDHNNNLCCKAFPEGIPFEFMYGPQALTGKTCKDKYGFEDISKSNKAGDEE